MRDNRYLLAPESAVACHATGIAKSIQRAITPGRFDKRLPRFQSDRQRFQVLAFHPVG